MMHSTGSQSGGRLLLYAASSLRPGIFLHPVWVRFGKREAPASLKIVDDLLGAARDLQAEDPGAACQVLLLCAAYQHGAGQSNGALNSTRQALSLAERAGLAREITWALWELCAIYVQQGDVEQAASHLLNLKSALSDQRQWMLADVAEVARQSLLHPLTEEALEALLPSLFAWPAERGSLDQGSALERGLRFGEKAGEAGSTGSRSTAGRRWSGWQTLMRVLRGELRLEWVEKEPRAWGRSFSSWRALLGLLASYSPARKNAAPASRAPPQVPGQSIARPAKSDAGRPAASSDLEQAASDPAGPARAIIPVAVQMLGSFGLTIGNLPLRLPASRGLALLKYLLLHHNQGVPREVLMDIFWREAEPETARNSLNVAMHALRQALRALTDLPVILFREGAYGLAPGLQVWLDVEEFERRLKAGQQWVSLGQPTDAATELEAAISLYQGDFLEDTPYEDWSLPERERLQMAYLDALERLSRIYFDQGRYAACITVCQLILGRDRCREPAHRLLMRCYSRQGQEHLALRQYQNCVEALRAELEVDPAPDTVQLHERIRRREPL